MLKFETSCDMGSIKIFNKGMACFFSNGIGDCPTTVYVRENKIKDMKDLGKFNGKHIEFLQHFTVRDKAYLSDYDCADSPIYAFGKGRWFVYRVEDAVMLIEKVDEDIHA
uniref:Uncharacterized protein n=1 Tax=viral metagenome TaxID=1070528 RepID=A0A6M3L1A8_9ZZZZ